MKKLTLESPDLVGRNIEALAELFPNCVTEAAGADGKVKRAVNFELLRQMLSADAVEGDEHYEFTWVGKRKAIAEAHRPIRKTLRPCPAESKNWDTTENLYIEGDNLEVLKLLQESYLGKVKMIYIDPPYNTGNDFIYRDDFAVTSEEYLEQMGMFDDEDNRLFKNSDSNGRFHSDWCSMMYSRLLLARNLLRHDGSIFISIDRHEADNLKKICDEVFGSDCFISNISWQRTYSTRNDSQGIVTEVEHILVYSKSPEWSPNKLPRTAEMNAKYKNPDNDVAPWRSDNAYAADAITHQGMVYATVFTEPTIKGRLGVNAMKAEKHLYDHLIYDSDNERKFAADLDTNRDVAVYVKLPSGFYISTPVGKYNPDWAIAFYDGSVKHIYFVAETKGSMSSLQLRELEQTKLHCAREHFKAISSGNVVYDVVDGYQSLLNLVRS